MVWEGGLTLLEQTGLARGHAGRAVRLDPRERELHLVNAPYTR